MSLKTIAVAGIAAAAAAVARNKAEIAVGIGVEFVVLEPGAAGIAVVVATAADVETIEKENFVKMDLLFPIQI